MRALIILAQGFEEIETVTVADILRRANIEVVLASLAGTVVSGSHKIKVVSEARIDGINSKDFDALILPSGDGSALLNSATVLQLVAEFNSKQKLLAAISTSPLVLAAAGVLDNRAATCCPGLESKLPHPRDADVVVDGHIITARAPGSAIPFGLKIVEMLAGRSAAQQLAKSLCV